MSPYPWDGNGRTLRFCERNMVVESIKMKLVVTLVTELMMQNCFRLSACLDRARITGYFKYFCFLLAGWASWSDSDCRWCLVARSCKQNAYKLISGGQGEESGLPINNVKLPAYGTPEMEISHSHSVRTAPSHQMSPVSFSVFIQQSKYSFIGQI